MRFWLYTKYSLSSNPGEEYATREAAEAERAKLLLLKYETPLPGNAEPNPLYRDYELWVAEGEVPPRGTYENECFYPNSGPFGQKDKTETKCWNCGVELKGYKHESLPLNT